MKRDEILEEILKTIACSAKENALRFFQLNLKGENALLLHLLDNGGQSTPGVIAEALSVSAARIAAMLRALELKKLVVRVCDEKDKRRVTVKITESGKQLVESVSETVNNKAQSLLERLGEEDAKEFLRLLKKCIGADENPPPENEKEANSESEEENQNTIKNDSVLRESDESNAESDDKR